MQTISAIYEQGVFRPVQPVSLPEHSQVELQVSLTAPSANAPSSSERASIEDKLAALAAQVPTTEWDRLPADRETLP
jgi:predicted DNA-binding antitoxin AbrB/MazE fold protein